MRKIWALPVATLALATLAACGSEKTNNNGVASVNGGAKTDPSASPSASMDPKDAQLKFAQCMRENGVDMPDPTDGQKGAAITLKKGQMDKMEPAMKKCRPILQAGGVIPNMNDPKVKDQMLKFAQCMRKNGVDMPDPSADGSMMMRAQKADGASKDTAEKAMEACKEFAPNGGRR